MVAVVVNTLCRQVCDTSTGRSMRSCTDTCNRDVGAGVTQTHSQSPPKLGCYILNSAQRILHEG
jgi:hypothetical protein